MTNKERAEKIYRYSVQIETLETEKDDKVFSLSYSDMTHEKRSKIMEEIRVINGKILDTKKLLNKLKIY